MNNAARRTGLLRAAAAAALLLSSGPGGRNAALGQDAPVFDFEVDTQGWTSPQNGSTVSTTQNAADVKVGQASLEWSYNPMAEDAGLQRPGPGLKAGASALDFWLRANATACLQLLLVEQDGSVYLFKCRAPADRWQHYRVSLSDLALSFSEDENRQLDLDQVGILLLQDLSRYTSDPEDLGLRKVWLDGLTFAGDAPGQRRATRTVDGKQEVLLDDFAGDTLGWFGRTPPALTLKKVEDRTVLHVRYEQAMNAKARFQMSDHVDTRYGQGKALRLVLRAPQASRIWLQLVENDGTYEGPGYAAAFEIPAGKDWQTRVLPLKDFAHEGKADANGKLDIDRVWMVQIADITTRDAPAPAELEIDSVGVLLSE